MCNNAHSEYFDILIRRADHKNQCAITCAHMLSHMTRNPTTNTSSAPCALVARTEISSFGQLVRDQTACHSTQKATITALRERCMLRAAVKLCWHMQTAAASGFAPLALAPPIRVIMNHMRVRMRGFARSHAIWDNTKTRTRDRAINVNAPPFVQPPPRSLCQCGVQSLEQP